MEPNPYSAPKAPVADPALVPVERPRAVTRAVHLLWISLVIGVAAGIDSFGDTPNDVTSRAVTIVFEAFWFGIPAWLIFKLARGRRWARTTYTILAVISYGLLALSWTETMKHLAEEPYQVVLLIGAASTELIALYLLFTKPSNQWFERPMRPAQP